jgi:class 3 adenylate cyclase
LLTPIRVRVGAHTGEPVRQAGELYGYHVNFAFRIVGVAEAGEIVVSSLLSEIIAPSGQFTLEKREPVTLKGFSGSHITYTVRWSDGDIT